MLDLVSSMAVERQRRAGMARILLDEHQSTPIFPMTKTNFAIRRERSDR